MDNSQKCEKIGFLKNNLLGKKDKNNTFIIHFNIDHCIFFRIILCLLESQFNTLKKSLVLFKMLYYPQEVGIGINFKILIN